jgi:glyoxalase family protein
MLQPIQGLHHITAVAGDPQRNVDFYQQVLGQRLVKTTVNFDDPGTYHLYYGDATGSPGTILTFFPWAHVRPGSVGNGEAATVAYAIPRDSVAYWQARLAEHGVVAGETSERWGETVLPFRDPDGMMLELVGTDRAPLFDHWADGPVPEAHALRGFHSVTLWVDEAATTAKILQESLGYSAAGQEGNRSRFVAGSDAMGVGVDLLQRPGAARGRFGAGSIHHIAFRVADDAEQLAYLDALRGAGLQVTPVQDRQYFHSIYYRVPAGVLFEMATDPPGFLLDESRETLGTALRLPPWLEDQRAQIERALPPLRREIPAAEGTR